MTPEEDFQQQQHAGFLRDTGITFVSILIIAAIYTAMTVAALVVR